MADVLLIEDELEVTDHLKIYFEMKEFTVTTAPTGEEGLELIKSEKPTLVLLDMKLGAGISGMEVLRQAKEIKGESHIIILTAVEDKNIAKMAMGLGADGYLTKPFAVDDLERIILPFFKK